MAGAQARFPGGPAAAANTAAPKQRLWIEQRRQDVTGRGARCPTPTGSGRRPTRPRREPTSSAPRRRQHAPPAQRTQDRALEQAVPRSAATAGYTGAARHACRAPARARARLPTASVARRRRIAGALSAADDQRQSRSAREPRSPSRRPPSRKRARSWAARSRQARVAERRVLVPGSGTGQRASFEPRQAPLQLAAKLVERRARRSGSGSRQASTHAASSVGEVRALGRAAAAAARRSRARSRPASRGGTGCRRPSTRTASAPASRRRPRPATLALGLLGRHVGERADHVAGRGQGGARRRATRPRSPSASPGARRRPRRDDHVLRLDVAVDDAARRGRGRAPRRGRRRSRRSRGR